MNHQGVVKPQLYTGYIIQCKDVMGYYPISIPIHLDTEHYSALLVSKVRSKPAQTSLVFSIDINKPMELTNNNLSILCRLPSDRLIGISDQSKAKFITAVSPNFPLYLQISPAAVALRSMYTTQPVYTAEAFTSSEANISL